MNTRSFASAVVLSLSCTVVFAQNLYNNATISISSGGTLYVRDTIINEGTIINNGDMQVGGSWINNADYDAGQGQITFNSEVPQIINHNDQSFSRLTVRGGGEKFFLADITVENELILENGTLVGRDDSRIIISESVEIVGGSDLSHIRGTVYHRGAGNKVFPVGDGSRYMPVEILNITGDSPEVGVRVFETGGALLRTSPGLTDVSTDRYWQVERVSGSLENARIVLPVRDEYIVTDVAGIVVAQSMALDQDFESIGQSDFEGTPANGKVTSDAAPTGNFFAIGTVSAADGIVVYNAVSPNGDDRNDKLIIGNIENFAENRFSLFNRWGDKVFEIQNYDNKERVFRGKTNIGAEKELSSGTYFYTIVTKENGKKTTGYLSVKR